MNHSARQEIHGLLEKKIEQAVQKLGVEKESEVCRYIPVSTGGYIHHFTFRKMKHQNPEQLCDMIEKHIIQCDGNPSPVNPKPRAPRGSRKGFVDMPFSKHHFERLLHMARLMGDKEIVRLLSRRTSDFKMVRKELIHSIKEGRADHDLWNSWVEIVTEQNQIFSNESSLHNLAI